MEHVTKIDGGFIMKVYSLYVLLEFLLDRDFGEDEHVLSCFVYSILYFFLLFLSFSFYSVVDLHLITWARRCLLQL